MSPRIDLSIEEPDPLPESNAKPVEDAAGSVSSPPLIVSKQVEGAMAAKVLESLMVQGFSCAECLKFHYKLYSLSPDCKGMLEKRWLWKPSALYQMELFCSTGTPTYKFELKITKIDKGGKQYAEKGR